MFPTWCFWRCHARGGATLASFISPLGGRARGNVACVFGGGKPCVIGEGTFAMLRRFFSAQPSQVALHDAIARLRSAGLDLDDAEASVRWLAQDARRRPKDQDRDAVFESSVSRRAQREPVQYIIGSWPFHPLPVELIVRPPVLIPRPETEELVDRVLAAYGHSSVTGCWSTTSKSDVHPQRILDIGSGSGAIVLALLHSFPDTHAVAVEPSPAAAALTEKNAVRCGVANRLKIARCNVMEWVRGATPGSFDLIISNPPYIPSKEILRLQAEVHHTQPAVFEACAAGQSSALNAELHPHRLAALHLVGTHTDSFGIPRFVELVVKG
eukprot:TRINITY_DN40994_c0_g1_i3.p1 TRINITY_DN40994_c0_g1~~TRINITY_DN40994_c0_g1_i3.p1  ORF type:complete len:326 (-),score=44.96 TRINITY_DN40994_c0_g1_i3:90-1067(-)